jgi:gas vesicle protein
MKTDTKKMLGGFLLGGMVGAILAILYTPKSGKEMRRDISKKARQIKNEAIDLIEDTIEDLKEFATDIKEKTEDIIEQGINISEKAKKELIEALEYSQNSIEKQRKKLKNVLGL